MNNPVERIAAARVVPVAGRGRRVDRVLHLPAVAPHGVVDTTAAGDAFAGAYLAARLTGAACASAAGSAAAVASVVIAHPGALTPRTVRLTPSG